jgi:hypothetical protein
MGINKRKIGDAAEKKAAAAPSPANAYAVLADHRRSRDRPLPVPMGALSGLLHVAEHRLADTGPPPSTTNGTWNEAGQYMANRGRPRAKLMNARWR